MRASLEERLRSELADLPYRRLFVGFSGGLDSTLLLHVARSVAATVTALHVDHGLHPDSARWASRCGERCRKMDVRLISRRTTAGDGSEAAARAARYAVFDGLLRAGDLLLLGHHQDDQAETVLLRLVQGRAPLGMPRGRRLPGGARILRPWLAVPRTVLLRSAREAGLDWIEDPANAAVDFDRNFLRREIVPRLAGRWPGVAKTLAGSAATQSARDELLDHLVAGGSVAARSGDTADTAPLTGAMSDAGRGSAPGKFPERAHRAAVTFHPGGASGPALGKLPRNLRVAALRLWLRGLGEFSVADSALAEFCRQFDAPPDAHPRLVLRHGALRRHADRAVYTGPDPELRSSYRLDPPGVLALPHGNLTVERHAAGFHAAGNLVVRFRRGGEHLRRGGRTRAVKKLLQAAGVPPWQRRTWPLIYSGDELVCLAGIAAADSPAGRPRWRAWWHPGTAP